MITATKQKKTIVSYILIAIWVFTMLMIKSIFWMSMISILLLFFSVGTSYLYYKGIDSTEEKKKYIVKKLTLFGLVVLASVLGYVFFFSQSH